MSVILDVYTELSKLEVGSIKSRNIDEINLTVRDGSLPLRLLMPVTEGDMSFIAIGNLQKAVWVIRDLCLFAPVSKGSGIHQYSKAMVDYISLYLEQIKANRSLVAKTHITGVGIEMLQVIWSEKTYWAIDISLTVEEIL
jgi:hypothetical protein